MWKRYLQMKAKFGVFVVHKQLQGTALYKCQNKISLCSASIWSRGAWKNFVNRSEKIDYRNTTTTTTMMMMTDFINCRKNNMILLTNVSHKTRRIYVCQKNHAIYFNNSFANLSCKSGSRFPATLNKKTVAYNLMSSARGWERQRWTNDRCLRSSSRLHKQNFAGHVSMSCISCNTQNSTNVHNDSTDTERIDTCLQEGHLLVIGQKKSTSGLQIQDLLRMHKLLRFQKPIKLASPKRMKRSKKRLKKIGIETKDSNTAKDAGNENSRWRCVDVRGRTFTIYEPARTADLILNTRIYSQEAHKSLIDRVRDKMHDFSEESVSDFLEEAWLNLTTNPCASCLPARLPAFRTLRN